MEDLHGGTADTSSPDIPLSGEAGMAEEPRWTAVVTNDPVAASPGLEAAIARLMAEHVTVLRLANPLTAPLTPRRILIQLGMDGEDEENGEDDGTRLERLLERRGEGGSLALVIEQAETLTPAALRVLRRLGAGPGHVRIMLAGASGPWNPFDAARTDRSLAPDGWDDEKRAEDAVAAPVQNQPPPVTPRPAFPVEAPVEAPVEPPVRDRLESPVEAARAEWRGLPMREEPMTGRARFRRRAWTRGLIGFFLLSGVAVLIPLGLGGFFYHGAPRQIVPVPLQVPPRTAGVPIEAPASPPATGPEPVSSPSPMAPPLPASPGETGRPSAPSERVTAAPVARPPAATGAARDETEDETRRAPPAPPPPPEDWRPASRRSQAPPSLSQPPLGQPSLAQPPLAQPPLAQPSLPPESSTGGRVVIHHREGGWENEAAARHLATAVMSLASRVQTRAVAATPSGAEIRFFHPEDEIRARVLAGALRGSGQRWEVRSFTAFRPRPSLGTVEMWLPAR